MKGHFKRKAERKMRQRDLKRMKLICSLEEKIKALQFEVEDNHHRMETRDRRFFSPAIRLCVMALLSLEVSTSQARAVIQTVSRLFFNHSFKASFQTTLTVMNQILTR